MTPRGNFTNHPSRLGTKITPHKGGRSVVRISSSLSPEDYARLRKHLDERHISLSDFILRSLGEDEHRTYRRDDILDALGAPSWEDVERAFTGKTIEEITADLDGMFPEDDNWFLARSIFEKLT